MILEKEFVMRLINNPLYLGKTAITPQDIGVAAYRDAYIELKRQLSEGGDPNLTSIISALPQHVGLLAEMNSIEIANFDYYDMKLSQDIQKKRLHIAKEYFVNALSSVSLPAEIIEELEALISKSWVSKDHRNIRSLYDAAMEFGPILEERNKHRGGIVGIPTGFPTLDGYTGGFQPGTYYIGARPSQGKTALMLTMLRSAANSGHGVGLISIESSDIELISRILSAEGNVNASALRTGAMKETDFPKLKAAYAKIKGYNGQVYFNTKTDVATLEAVARIMVKTNKVEIIFIDYLQRVYAKGNTKFEQVAAASRAVTDIAKGLGVPVICLVQTGRAADKEAPTLNHFQYSSAIEQDADVAMIIDPADPAGMGDVGLLCVLKNRDGMIGDVPIVFHKERVCFSEERR